MQLRNIKWKRLKPNYNRINKKIFHSWIPQSNLDFCKCRRYVWNSFNCVIISLKFSFCHVDHIFIATRMRYNPLTPRSRPGFQWDARGWALGIRGMRNWNWLGGRDRHSGTAWSGRGFNGHSGHPGLWDIRSGPRTPELELVPMPAACSQMNSQRWHRGAVWMGNATQNRVMQQLVLQNLLSSPRRILGILARELERGPRILTWGESQHNWVPGGAALPACDFVVAFQSPFCHLMICNKD